MRFRTTESDFYDFIRTGYTPLPHICLLPKVRVATPLLREPPAGDQLITDHVQEPDSRPRVELLGRRSKASPHVASH